MKKLALNKETVRSLNVEETAEVAGGTIVYYSVRNTCYCPVVSTPVCLPTNTIGTSIVINPGPISYVAGH